MSTVETFEPDTEGRDSNSDGSYRPNYVIAAEKIIEFIARTGLRPGDRLPTEQALAEELDYGRGVIREALKILSALGRVNAHRGRGLFVADDPHLRLGSADSFATFLPAEPKHVDELLTFRQIVEAAAASRAARTATPPQIRRLRQAANECSEAAAAGDRSAFDRADARFHEQLMAASGNRFLESAGGTARRLQAQVVAIGLHGGTGGSIVEAAADHEDIVQAVANGEPAEAARSAERHVERTLAGYQFEIASRLRDVNMSVDPKGRD